MLGNDAESNKIRGRMDALTGPDAHGRSGMRGQSKQILHVIRVANTKPDGMKKLMNGRAAAGEAGISNGRGGPCAHNEKIVVPSRLKPRDARIIQ